MTAQRFATIIDIWLHELDRYTFEQILSKPAADNWSIGQLYMHLIDTTNYFLEQAMACTTSNAYATEEAHSAATAMFERNDFPDQLIEGPPSNACTPQPESKEQLISAFKQLKKEIAEVNNRLNETRFKGKTKHPGLNYFNGQQWFQFAEMHLRHHLRQKKRIDEFLKLDGYEMRAG
jgi:hypothetical protein